MLLRYYYEFMDTIGFKPMIRDTSGLFANTEAALFFIILAALAYLFFYIWLCVVPDYKDKIDFAYNPFGAFLHLMDVPAMILLAIFIAHFATKILMKVIVNLVVMTKVHGWPVLLIISAACITIGIVIYLWRRNRYCN